MHIFPCPDARTRQAVTAIGWTLPDRLSHLLTLLVASDAWVTNLLCYRCVVMAPAIRTSAAVRVRVTSVVFMTAPLVL